LEPVFLSNTELYLSSSIDNGYVVITDEEQHHIINVMRHKINDNLNVTDGKGNIYNTEIVTITKTQLTAKIISTLTYPNTFQNIIFCIPRLKNNDRFEFALEKCVELGINRFIVFDSDRTVAKGNKIDRWQKLITSAMKQSLQAWLPTVSYAKNFNELMKLEGKKFIFDQKGEMRLNEIMSSGYSTELLMKDTLNYFVFGPEGGFSSEEYRVMSEELKIRLTSNRLRSETAIITAAVLLFTS
jgi:16S rRNA (uracil1498-N3)-methyltransferase